MRETVAVKIGCSGLAFPCFAANRTPCHLGLPAFMHKLLFLLLPLLITIGLSPCRANVGESQAAFQELLRGERPAGGATGMDFGKSAAALETRQRSDCRSGSDWLPDRVALTITGGTLPVAAAVLWEHMAAGGLAATRARPHFSRSD